MAKGKDNETEAEQAQEAGAMLIESLVQDPIIERKLRGAGFFRHRQAPFIVKNLSTDDFQTDVLDHGAWSIIGGDVDTF